MQVSSKALQKSEPELPAGNGTLKRIEFYLSLDEPVYSTTLNSLASKMESDLVDILHEKLFEEYLLQASVFLTFIIK